MDKIYCNKCSNFLPQNAKFCGICGSQVVALQYCSCGNTIKPNTKVCGSCGKSFTQKNTNNKNVKIIATIIGVFFGFVILVTATYFIVNSTVGLERDASDSPGELTADLSEIPDFPESFVPILDDNNSFGKRTEILNSENPVFVHEGVSLRLMSDFIDDDIELNVNPVKMDETIEGVTVTAYDFSIDGNIDDLGIVEIRIPIDNFDNSSIYGAGYFNEDINQWEPVIFEVDKVNNEIVIYTNHLSIYSCFAFSGKGTRYHRISYVYAMTPAYDYHGTYDAILLEAINNNMIPGQKALKLGLDVTSEWLGFTGAGLTLQGLAYSSDYLTGLSNAFTNVGGALALLQLASDYSKGETKKASANALKNAVNFAVSKFGSSALQVGFVGVFAIDYSLNKFAQAAISGREQIYQNAYNVYYRNDEIGSMKLRSPKDWFLVFVDMMDNAQNPEELNELIEKEIDEYVNYFWSDYDGMTWAFSEVQRGFSYSGGSNISLEQRISNNHKVNLIEGPLKSVFLRLEREQRIRQEEGYRKALEEVKNEMNKVVTVNIIEQSSSKDLQYAGYYVKFAPLSYEADPKMWTGRLNKEGKIRATFTVLGHLMAGAPDRIDFYKDKKALENEEVDFSMEIELDVPVTNIAIGELELKIGDKYQGGIVAYILQPGEPDYKSGHIKGVIAAEHDQGSAKWGCAQTKYGTSTEYGTGRDNTNKIIAGCSEQNVARICDKLSLNGYSDWFLPSKDELNILYINRKKIGGFEIKKGNKDVNYRSSSEDPKENPFVESWLQDFLDGAQYNLRMLPDKVEFKVRCVRYFEE